MESLEQENRRLRDRIAELEQQLGSSKPQTTTTFEKAERLSNAEIRRYGRQLILPGFGIPGKWLEFFNTLHTMWVTDSQTTAQLKLRNSSVLIVGAGGLGSPAALYLGAGGVGRLGIVDHDTVDVSNLHRQVIHKEKTQGISKAVSAMMAVNEYVCEISGWWNTFAKLLLPPASIQCVALCPTKPFWIAAMRWTS